MNNLKRFTVCKLAGHKWLKISYPPTADGEATGTFLRCERCDKENHEAGTHARGGGSVFWSGWPSPHLPPTAVTRPASRMAR